MRSSVGECGVALIENERAVLLNLLRKLRILLVCAREVSAHILIPADAPLLQLTLQQALALGNGALACNNVLLAPHGELGLQFLDALLQGGDAGGLLLVELPALIEFPTALLLVALLLLRRTAASRAARSSARRRTEREEEERRWSRAKF